MSMRDLTRRIKYLLHREEFANDLDEEMRLHLELRASRLRERGMNAEEARFAARRQFGNRAAVEIASSEAWGWTVWERLAQDVRQALRALRKTPGFTAVVVATLAVGLGMNTAVFSIVNAVMLRSLPYRQPDRLVSLWEEATKREEVSKFNSSGQDLGGAGSRQRTTVAAANLIDYRKRTNAFEALAGVESTRMNLTGNGPPERLSGERVTANYFSTLSVTPEIGRTFTAQEDSPEGDAVVVVSHSFWQRRLGGDTAVFGRSLLLDSRAYKVIGVMPPDLEPVTRYGQVDPVEFFVPAAYSKELLANHGDHDINVVGRLNRGVSLQVAQEQLSAVSAALEKQYPESNLGMRARISPLRDDLVQNVKDSLHALFGASGLILLITCVNVANLLLVRAVGRRHEISVRFALGAGRMRVARQFLAESMLLAAAGCAAGILLGRILMRALVAAAPQSIPRLDTVSLDWTVFGAAAATAALTGLAFGLAPAWRASRIAPSDSLKSSERKAGSRSLTRWRAALTVAEIALSLVLLIGAGLFLKSFTLIMGMDLGFRTERLLAMNINLPELHYRTAEQRLQFFQELERRVGALPGVQSIAFANRFPLRGGWSSGISIDGVGETNLSPDSQAVSTGYFETLAVSLVRGRRLTPADRLPGPHVAVVNQAFSRQYLDGGDPIGRRFRRGSNAPWVEIVGLVNDVRRGGKTKDIRPQVYLPAAQTDAYPVRLADFAVRTAGDPRLLVNAIQQQVWSLDKDLPVTGVRTMEEIISLSVSAQRFQMLLLTLFAGVAVALALIGIFGVLSYGVNQRMNELGIRVALGARPREILGLVLKQAGVLIAVGVVLGLAGALALTRLVASLLFHVQAYDWATYAAAVVMLALSGVAAALIPARRGARVDPIVALRYE
jgi:putative ABC transport system permease protein